MEVGGVVEPDGGVVEREGAGLEVDDAEENFGEG